MCYVFRVNTDEIELLRSLGLTPNQAKLYGTLLEKGPQKARELAAASNVPRALAYRTLDELVDLGLAERDEKTAKVLRYAPLHPNALLELGKKRVMDSEGTLASLQSKFGTFVSLYNLRGGKPGVRFYAGKEGIRECINDALTSRTEICSYVDIAAIEKNIPDISRDFAKARQRLKIKKKNIGVDTPDNRAEIEGYYTDVTEERLIPWPTQKFGTVMQIYDGKVSYMTIEEPMIGIIIADSHIYEMHRSLFEFTWNSPLIYIPGKDKIQATFR